MNWMKRIGIGSIPSISREEEFVKRRTPPEATVTEPLTI